MGTAATVVGLATGVLTLKDQLFPPDQPTAQTVAQYQQQVGEVCDRVNAVLDSRVRRARRYEKRLNNGKDLAESRNAMMDEVQNRIDFRRRPGAGRAGAVDVGGGPRAGITVTFTELGDGRTEMAT